MPSSEEIYCDDLLPSCDFNTLRSRGSSIDGELSCVDESTIVAEEENDSAGGADRIEALSEGESEEEEDGSERAWHGSARRLPGRSSPSPIIISSERDCEEAVRTFKKSMGDSPFIGLDLEGFDAGNMEKSIKGMFGQEEQRLANEMPRKMVENTKLGKPLLLQMSTMSGYTLLIRIGMFRTIPKCIVDLLVSQKIAKCGVKILEDRRWMESGWGVCIRCCVELNDVVRRMAMGAERFKRHRHRTDVPICGLKRLAASIFGQKCLPKFESRISWGNWGRKELTSDQILYAAFDSQIAIDILLACMGPGKTMMKPVDHQLFGDVYRTELRFNTEIGPYMNPQKYVEKMKERVVGSGVLDDIGQKAGSSASKESVDEQLLVDPNRLSRRDVPFFRQRHTEDLLIREAVYKSRNEFKALGSEVYEVADRRNRQKENVGRFFADRKHGRGPVYFGAATPVFEEELNLQKENAGQTKTIRSAGSSLRMVPEELFGGILDEMQDSEFLDFGVRFEMVESNIWKKEFMAVRNHGDELSSEYFCESVQSYVVEYEIASLIKTSYPGETDLRRKIAPPVPSPRWNLMRLKVESSRKNRKVAQCVAQKHIFPSIYRESLNSEGPRCILTASETLGPRIWNGRPMPQLLKCYAAITSFYSSEEGMKVSCFDEGSRDQESGEQESREFNQVGAGWTERTEAMSQYPCGMCGTRDSRMIQLCQIVPPSYLHMIDRYPQCNHNLVRLCVICRKIWLMHQSDLMQKLAVRLSAPLNLPKYSALKRCQRLSELADDLERTRKDYDKCQEALGSKRFQGKDRVSMVTAGNRVRTAIGEMADEAAFLMTGGMVEWPTESEKVHRPSVTEVRHWIVRNKWNLNANYDWHEIKVLEKIDWNVNALESVFRSALRASCLHLPEKFQVSHVCTFSHGSSHGFKPPQAFQNYRLGIREPIVSAQCFQHVPRTLSISQPCESLSSEFKRNVEDNRCVVFEGPSRARASSESCRIDPSSTPKSTIVDEAAAPCGFGARVQCQPRISELTQAYHSRANSEKPHGNGSGTRLGGSEVAAVYGELIGPESSNDVRISGNNLAVNWRHEASIEQKRYLAKSRKAGVEAVQTREFGVSLHPKDEGAMRAMSQKRPPSSRAPPPLAAHPSFSPMMKVFFPKSYNL